jgi:hypothetical protein
MRITAVIAILLAASAAPVCMAEREEVPLPGDQYATSIEELFGVWKVGAEGGAANRTLEFRPDGSAVEAATAAGSQPLRRTWSVEDGKILITGTPGWRMEIPLPFHKQKMALTEITETADTTVTRRLEATRAAPTAAPAAKPSPTTTSLSRIALTVTPSRRSDGAYPAVQTLSLTLTLRNADIRNPTGPFQVEYLILGADERDARLFALLDRGSFAAELGASIADRELKRTTDPRVVKYYHASRGYFSYSGWAVLLRDPSGKISLVEASRPEWEKLPERLDALKMGKVYDKSLTVVAGAPLYNISSMEN